MSILSGIISLILSLGIAVFWFFFLLLALNGFTGRAGDYAIYTYFAWVIILTLIIGAISFFGTGFLIKKSFNKALSVIIPVIISVVLAGGGHFFGIIMSTVIAQEIWKK